MVGKLFLTVSVTLWCFVAAAILPRHHVMDSLADKDYSFFIERLNRDDLHPSQSLIYCRAYLAKAKRESNYQEMMYAYKGLLHLGVRPGRLAYADSMVWAASRSRNQSLLGSAYLTKGIVYYDLKEYTFALDNYLTANRYIAQESDEYLKHKIKFNIAQIKLYLGFYQEAIALLRDCVEFYAHDGNKPYLSSLHSLGLAYNRTGKYRLCAEVNELGIREAVRVGDESLLPYFHHSQGVNFFFLKQYKDSNEMLRQALPGILKAKDSANVTVAHFYAAKNHQELGDVDKAIPYFEKVDEAFRSRGYIRPDLREAYEILINYYREKGNLEAELRYIDRLLKVDQVLLRNYKYLSGKIFKEYDTRELIAAKSAVENELRRETQSKRMLSAGVVVLGCLAGLFRYRQVATRRRYKREFEELMNNRGKASKRKPAEAGVDGLDITPSIIEAVLEHLDEFERRQGFRKPDLTLTDMAEMFDSNNTYVSKIIWHYKGRKPNEYVNDLRIAYIIDKLKEQPKFRRYSNAALASEAGFATTQSFTKAFVKRVGMSPTVYVQGLLQI